MKRLALAAAVLTVSACTTKDTESASGADSTAAIVTPAPAMNDSMKTMDSTGMKMMDSTGRMMPGMKMDSATRRP